MQSTTFTSYNGRRSVGGMKGFIFQKDTPFGSGRKGSTNGGSTSHSSVEIIEHTPKVKALGGMEGVSSFNKDAAQAEEDFVPANEFESDGPPGANNKELGEDATGTEEEKGLPANANKVPDTFIKDAGSSAFKRKRGESKLVKSVTCSLLAQFSEDNKEAPETSPTLKDTKSPDPFEDTHSQSETKLMGLINSTTSPESPLYGMHKSGTRSSSELKAYKHFIISLFESACFIRKMTPIPDSTVAPQRLFLQHPKDLPCNKTLVLDLDETLVHCVDEGQPSDIQLPIRLPDGTIINAGINIRPGTVSFLEQISKVYEVVVFTASHQSYANAILDHLERGKEKKLVHHRLYRQNCVKYRGSVYIKDLRVLQRELKDVLIVDNAPYSFASQIDNGYPITPFYDDKSDEELTTLLTYLQSLEKAEDVRSVNQPKFRLKDITETNICEYAKYYQHTNSDASGTEQSQESLPSHGDESPGMYEKVKAPMRQLQGLMSDLFKAENKQWLL